MRLRPARAPARLISLVSMIDVLMIMLVFFMVTSTYLDLDMLPMAGGQDPDGGAATAEAPGLPVLVRLGADGRPAVQGRTLDDATLGAMLAARLAQDARLRVLVLPSGAASTQALVSVMDVAARAGVRQVRVVRLEATR